MAVVALDPKRCTSCQEAKPRSEFSRIARLPKAVRSRCKECMRKEQAVKFRDNPEKTRASTRKSKLKTKWGMTLEQFDQMLATQGGGCAICGTPEPGGRGRFPVDHCHTNGKIRGLLCVKCNLGIGGFADDTDRMRRAIAYLEGSR